MGYYQIPVHAMNIPKIAVITPFGLSEFLCTLLGIANATQAFQRLMDSVLWDFYCVFIYLDDILMASSSPVQCFQKFTGVFDHLEQHDLFIHPGRCVFGVTEITFLGHGINTEGIQATPTNHLRFSLPYIVKEFRAFLRVITFYDRFVPAAA